MRALHEAVSLAVENAPLLDTVPATPNTADHFAGFRDKPDDHLVTFGPAVP